jgi:hypothetical protein
VLNGWSYIINATYKVTEKHIRGQNELKLVLINEGFYCCSGQRKIPGQKRCVGDASG